MLLPSNSLKRILSVAAILPLLAACSSTTDAARTAVSLSVRAPTSSVTSGTATAGAQVTSLHLLVNQASLGSGDQFGCVDCQGGSESGNEAGVVGGVISVPLDGSAVNLATEQVQVGVYPQVEIELGGATPAGWAPGQTVEIQGSNNGVPFTIRVAVNGAFRETLSPPVTVSSATTSVPVVITLPVASWFVSAGQALDPAVPSQLAQIEANIKASFSGTETNGNEA
jgi:hypothetical protein